MLLSRLLVLFIAVPLVELFILIKTGRFIGAANTVAIVVITGILGAILARSQSVSILARIRDAFYQGKAPGRELIEGAFVLVGGVMLITPGFLTDIAGFTMVLPLTRAWYREHTVRWMQRKIQSGSWSNAKDSDPFAPDSAGPFSDTRDNDNGDDGDPPPGVSS